MIFTLDQFYKGYPKKISIYPYQLDFLSFARNYYFQNKGFILGDGMGLGKTRQSIALIGILDTFCNLIVIPSRTNNQWIHEANETLFDYNIFYYDGKFLYLTYWNGDSYTHNPNYPYSCEDVAKDGRKKVIIASYESIRPKSKGDKIYTNYFTNGNDFEWVDEKQLDEAVDPSYYLPELTPLNDFVFNIIIADEAHRLRNGYTLVEDKSKKATSSPPKIFKSMCRLRLDQNGGIKIAVTGTPLQNRKSDLASLLKFIGVNVLSKKSDKYWASIIATRLFMRRPEDLIPQLKRSIKFPNFEPIIVKNYVQYKTKLEEEFVTFAAGVIAGVDQGIQLDLLQTPYCQIEVKARNPLEKFNYMKFLSASYDMIIVQSNKNFEKSGKNFRIPNWMYNESKNDMITDELYNIALSNESAIIFVHYDLERESIISAIEKYYDTKRRNGINVNYLGENLGFENIILTGSITTEETYERINLSRKYEKMGKRHILFINILSGGEGLNLQHLHIALFPSADCNPQLIEQAKSRIHRLHQERQTYLISFVHKKIELLTGSDNIDSYIEEMNEVKLSLFKSLLIDIPNAAFFSPRMEIEDENGFMTPSVIFKNFDNVPELKGKTLEDMETFTSEIDEKYNINPYAPAIKYNNNKNISRQIVSGSNEINNAVLNKPLYLQANGQNYKREVLNKINEKNEEALTKTKFSIYESFGKNNENNNKEIGNINNNMNQEYNQNNTNNMNQEHKQNENDNYDYQHDNNYYKDETNEQQENFQFDENNNFEEKNEYNNEENLNFLNQDFKGLRVTDDVEHNYFMKPEYPYENAYIHPSIYLNEST